MKSLEFIAHDMASALIVFLTVLGGLLLLKAFMARQLRRLEQAVRASFLHYIEQLVSRTRLPFFVGIAPLAGITLAHRQ